MAQTAKTYDFNPTVSIGRTGIFKGVSLLPNGVAIPVRLPSDYEVPQSVLDSASYWNGLVEKYYPKPPTIATKYDQAEYDKAFTKYLSNEIVSAAGATFDANFYTDLQNTIDQYENVKGKTDTTSKQRASELKAEIDKQLVNSVPNRIGVDSPENKVFTYPQSIRIAELQAQTDAGALQYGRDLAKGTPLESTIAKYYQDKDSRDWVTDFQKAFDGYIPEAKKTIDAAVQSAINSNLGSPQFAKYKALEQLSNQVTMSPDGYGAGVIKGAVSEGLTYDQYLGNYGGNLAAWENDVARAISKTTAYNNFNDIVYNKVDPFKRAGYETRDNFYRAQTSADNKAIQQLTYLDRHFRARQEEISQQYNDLVNQLTNIGLRQETSPEALEQTKNIQAQMAALTDAFNKEKDYVYSKDFVLEGENLNRARQIYEQEVRDRVNTARRAELSRDELRLDRRNELLAKQQNNTLTAEEARILRGEAKDPVTDSYYPFRTSEDFIDLTKQPKSDSEYQKIMDELTATGRDEIILAPTGPAGQPEAQITPQQKAARQDQLYTKLYSGTITPQEVQILLGKTRDPVTNTTLTPSQNMQRELESYLQATSLGDFEQAVLGINLPEGQFSSTNLAEQRVRELFTEQGYTLNTPENREALARWTTLFKDLGENAAMQQWNQGVTQQQAQRQTQQQTQIDQSLPGLAQQEASPVQPQSVLDRTSAEQIYRAMLSSGGYDYDKMDPITNNYFVNYLQRFGAEAGIAEYEKLGGQPVGARYQFADPAYTSKNYLTYDTGLDVAKRLFDAAGWPKTGYSINQNTGERIDNEENLRDWARAAQNAGLDATIEQWNKLNPNKSVAVKGFGAPVFEERTDVDPETGAVSTIKLPRFMGTGTTELDFTDLFATEQTRRQEAQDRAAGEFRSQLDFILSGGAAPQRPFTPSDVYGTTAPVSGGTYTPGNVYGTAGTTTGTTTSYPSPYLTYTPTTTTTTTTPTTLPPPSMTPQPYAGTPFITQTERPTLDTAIEYIESTRPGAGPMPYMTPQQVGATPVEPASYADLFGYTPYTDYIEQSEYTTPMRAGLYGSGYIPLAEEAPAPGLRGGGSVAREARGLASMGRGGDTMLVHMAPEEVAGLRALAMREGTDLTINPETGLPEAKKLKRLFKEFILPAAAAYFGAPYLGGVDNAAALFGAARAVKTGSFEKGLMAGLSAYGGASLASSAFGAPTAFGATTGTGSVVTGAEGAGASGTGTVGGEYGGVDGMFAAPPASPPPPPATTLAPPPSVTSTDIQAGIGGATPGADYSDLLSKPAGANIPPLPPPPAAAQPGARQIGKLEEITGVSPTTALIGGTMLAGLGEGEKERDLYEEERRRQEEEEERRRRLGQTAFELGQRPIDTRMMYGAGGGLVALARGGMTYMEAGGTTGSTGEPRMVAGTGDGMSDSVPATIEGVQEARLANDEFVIPADVVADIGNGSSSAGARKLYDMMDRIREARHGTTEQPPEINAEQYMPA